MRAWFRTVAGGLACALIPLVQAATITAVSPQGEVAQVRQVVVRFSAAVVTFGDPRASDPVTLTCQGDVPAGTGRWSNDREWLYDFKQSLPPGTSCVVNARADWQPLNGGLTGTTRFTFQTGGPAVLSSQPNPGGTIDEDQLFLLRLSGSAVASSVLTQA